MSTNTFKSLGLPQETLNNLNNLGYENMTPIQAQALPHALEGRDIIAQAQTGSGKTVAFGLALLQKIDVRNFRPQALILCPTRELSAQVATSLRETGRYKPNLKILTLCGGQPIGPQIGSLEHGTHIIVATPGRLKDHLRKETVSLANLHTLVLDEADRMLEMGFMEDVESIIKQTPSSRQSMLFSATYPKDIESLSQRIQRNPISVVLEDTVGHQDIEQRFYQTDKGNRYTDLLRAINQHGIESAVLFCNTKQACRDVSEFMANAGLSSLPLHGDLEQRDRDQTLIRFKHHSCSFLVATDVAARGLDIEQLPAVINVELPRDPEVYVHRIGRTGRAGKKGLAISLVTNSEEYKLQQIDDSVEVEALVKGNHLPEDLKAPMVTLCIIGGRKDKIRKGDILGAITREGGIAGRSVGKIEVLDYSSFVSVERESARAAIAHLKSGKIKGRNCKVRRL